MANGPIKPPVEKVAPLVDPLAIQTAISGVPSSLQDAYLALAIQDLQKKLGEQAEAEMLRKKAQESGARAMQQKRDTELAAQENCPHMQPNFQSAVAGQKDHQHQFRWICQYCAKEWIGSELPPHLRISADKVGGPQ